MGAAKPALHFSAAAAGKYFSDFVWPKIFQSADDAVDPPKRWRTFRPPILQEEHPRNQRSFLFWFNLLRVWKEEIFISLTDQPDFRLTFTLDLTIV
ncbi:MAG: hypothetical protein ACOY90_13775 [Candidatus Zhuqueibacterota bacterium]